MALTPVVLRSLSQTPAGSAASARDAVPRTPAFARPAFRAMRLISLKGDHVVAAIDGRIREYAFGHLPPSARTLIRAPGNIQATTADAQQRTVLGILSDDAIDDIHDEDPLICPVALSVIRREAVSPAETIRGYISAAPMVSTLSGRETGNTGTVITYQRTGRALTAEWRGGNWTLLHDRIEIDERIPVTTCLAAIGRPLSDLVRHPVLDGHGAVVTGTRPEEWGTGIVFDVQPVRARATDEAAY